MSDGSAFERIRRLTDDGADYWLARELGRVVTIVETGSGATAVRG